MVEPDGPVRLVLTPASADLRRRLGPTGWAVLEDVLLHGEPREGTVVAATSVRDVAGRLGVARATAGRALGRLLDESLLHRRQDRQRQGTFGPATYECRLDALAGIDLVAVPEDTTETKPSVPTTAPSRRRARQHHRHQPTLFAEGPDTDRHQEAEKDPPTSCTHGHPQVPGLPNAFPIGERRC